MKRILSLVAPFALVAPLHAEDAEGVKELANNYMKLFNRGEVETLMKTSLCRTGVSEEMLELTRSAMGRGGKIESFTIDAPTDRDRILFTEGQEVTGYGRLFVNIEPEQVIVFKMVAKDGAPAATQRSLVGREDGKWLLAMLVSEKKKD